MKKQYICPESLMVRLHTTHSLLSVSGRDSGTLNINNTDDVITNPSEVWTKENNNLWNDEW